DAAEGADFPQRDQRMMLALLECVEVLEIALTGIKQCEAVRTGDPFGLVRSDEGERSAAMRAGDLEGGNLARLFFIAPGQGRYSDLVEGNFPAEIEHRRFVAVIESGERPVGAIQVGIVLRLTGLEAVRNFAFG